jgi:hypothetical protein
LLAGPFPGEYHLVARSRLDGSVLATHRFRVTSCWPDDVVGPGVHVTGDHQPFRLMSWGGTGAADYFVDPAPDRWRVAVVLVATKDRRWGAITNSAKDDWKERVIGGSDSAKRFYEEVSYRNTPAGGAGDPVGMTVELVGGRVLGPIDLDVGWGDVFKPKKGGGLDGGWVANSTSMGILADAVSTWMADQADGHSMMELADTIAIVTRSGSDVPTPMVGNAPPIPTRYVWGHASRTDFWRKDPVTSTLSQGPKPVVLMTDVYPAGLPVAPILAHTLSHEIGHNLGLADLYDAKGDYPAEINVRSANDADIMASSRPLPHFSLANRIRLGWVRRQWLRRFDFSASPTGGDVTLQATERLGRKGPPGGRFAGVEVPIEDGWSYFFEFRGEQAGQVGDQELQRLTASQRMVLGTDVRANGGMAARPPILLLPADGDGDGPVLDAVGVDYVDSDTTNPSRMHDFALKVTGFGVPDADGAKVRIDYLEANRPQLQIRAAPGCGNFKSPDIELLNPLGLGALGAIKGMTNTIAVTVHNLGTLAATGVQVHVKWVPFTTSAGSWTSLPDPSPFSVPAKGSTKFALGWPIPPSVKVGDVEADHFCVRVEIDRYLDAAHPEHQEIVVFDNWAQSNFDSGLVSFGSPSERISTVATAANPLDRDATFLFTGDQSSEWYRVYVGNAWLRLPPGEGRAIELAYESLAGDPVHGEAFDRNLERITTSVNHVAVTSWLVPEGTECDTPREWWGVGLDLRTGRRCWFEDVRRNGELVTARVLGSVDGEVVPVTSGHVRIAAWPEDDPENVAVTLGEIRADGTARVLVGNTTLALIAEGRVVVAAMGREHDVRFAQAVSELVRLD